LGFAGKADWANPKRQGAGQLNNSIRHWSSRLALLSVFATRSPTVAVRLEKPPGRSMISERLSGARKFCQTHLPVVAAGTIDLCSPPC
jgi:hypothetical protein